MPIMSFCQLDEDFSVIFRPRLSSEIVTPAWIAGIQMAMLDVVTPFMLRQAQHEGLNYEVVPLREVTKLSLLIAWTSPALLFRHHPDSSLGLQPKSFGWFAGP